LAAALCFPAGAPRAENAGSQGVYTPKAPMQSTPMRVEVIDGATFRDIETGLVFRLFGIDACRRDQAANLGRQPWQCGVAAIAWLTTATLNKWVSCNTLREKDGQRIARCSSSEHADLAGDMIKEGLAVCLPDSEDQRVRSYLLDEEQARKAYKGLWSSQFAMPWDYRAKEASNPKRAP
jgi:endonuclease YncB( thermonuclease family)